MSELDDQKDEIKIEEVQEENDKPVTILLMGLGFGCLGAILFPVIIFLIFIFLVMHFT